jgi:hypothetical protein
MRGALLSILFFKVVTAGAQELAQVSFTGGSGLRSFALVSDQDLLIRISPEGHLLEWGVEMQSIRSGNYYAPKLQPYPGRIDYYGPEADSVSRGKVKSIGSAVITYFQGYETPEKVGKIRSVGRQFFDYYGNFDQKILQGKIKGIGNTSLEYYTGFDDPSLQGKLKSVGSTRISYYNSFDDKFIRGKLKSIGTVSYTWYSSLENNSFGGGLKAGPLRQNTGGVVYIIQ